MKRIYSLLIILFISINCLNQTRDISGTLDYNVAIVPPFMENIGQKKQNKKSEKKNSGINNYMYGKKLSNKEKKRLSDMNSGEKKSNVRN